MKLGLFALAYGAILEMRTRWKIDGSYYIVPFKVKSCPCRALAPCACPPLPSGEVDEQTTRDMVKLALDSGVNYFDTAYPYHSGASERVIGRALADCPRESFYLATKYPGHQVKQSYDPAAVF